MNKKVILFLLIASLAVFLLFAGCGEQDDVIELHFATFWPGTDFQVTEGHEAWMNDIEERTDGQVRFVMHAGEALLGGREIYEGVVAGSADLGTTCPSYTPGMFPVTEAFELTGMQNPNALAASMTVNEGYKVLKEEGLMEEYDDVKVLMFWATGPGDVMTTSPVESLDDVEGMEMRVVGGSVSAMEELGVTPVSMPMSESYIALDSRIVEGILAPTDTLKGFGLAEVVDYVTETPFLYNMVFMKVMNQQKWDSLPPDVQEVIEEVSEEYVMEYGKLRTEHTIEGLEYGKQEHGIEVLELTSEEESIWLEKIKPVVEEWIEKTEDAGLPGREIVDTVRELDEKFADEHGDY